MKGRILVAGATGTAGRALVSALADRGWAVRALVRRDGVVPRAVEHAVGDLGDAAALEAACQGCDAVFSAAGASLALALRPGSPGFESVDRDGTLRLVAAAERAGVPLFGYVSVFHSTEQADLAYVRAHVAVEEAVHASSMTGIVVRPTGLFPALEPLLRIARLGVAPDLGGEARSNPVHPADLAEVCADALDALPAGEIGVGGPDVLTRREMFESAFAALGRSPRFVPVPTRLIRANATLVRPLDRRLSDVLFFFERVATTDAVAPRRGSRRLADYFAALTR